MARICSRRCNVPRRWPREGRNAMLGIVLLLMNPLLMTMLKTELY